MPSQAPAPRVSPGAHPPVPPARASSLPRGEHTHAAEQEGGWAGTPRCGAAGAPQSATSGGPESPGLAVTPPAPAGNAAPGGLDTPPKPAAPGSPGGRWAAGQGRGPSGRTAAPAGRGLPGTPAARCGACPGPAPARRATAAGAPGKCQARDRPALPRTGTDLRGSSRRHRRPGRAARRAQLRQRPPGSPQHGLDEAGGRTPAAGKHLPPRHPRHRGTGATGSAPAACPGLAPPPQGRAPPRGIMGAVGRTRAPRPLPRPFATTAPGRPLRPRGACWEMESAHSPAARGMAGVVVLVRRGGTPLPRAPRGGAGGRKFRCLAVGALGLARRPRLRRRRR